MQIARNIQPPSSIEVCAMPSARILDDRRQHSKHRKKDAIREDEDKTIAIAPKALGASSRASETCFVQIG